ncbi:MAG TPA: cytochrome c oxidase subunit 4 [Acidimicrobiales bacterium]
MSAVPTEEGAGQAVGLRIFLALAVFFLLLAIVYFATSDGEWAGAVLLALSAGLSVVTGGFLFLVDRRGGLREELDPADYEDRDVLFLPHASLRPFWLGAGIVLMAAGLPLGAWLFLPGLVLLGVGLVGLVEEGRRR